MNVTVLDARPRHAGAVAFQLVDPSEPKGPVVTCARCVCGWEAPVFYLLRAGAGKPWRDAAIGEALADLRLHEGTAP